MGSRTPNLGRNKTTGIPVVAVVASEHAAAADAASAIDVRRIWDVVIGKFPGDFLARLLATESIYGEREGLGARQGATRKAAATAADV